MAGIILLVVLSGFAPTLYLRPLFEVPPIPAYLYLHGIVLTSWFVWLFLQTLLVQAKRTDLHRQMGLVGAVIAAAVPVMGLVAAGGLVPRVLADGIRLDADAGTLGIGVAGMTVASFLAQVVWGNISSAVSFALLAWSGLLLRRRTRAHKRLMLLASVAILAPALSRLARLPMLGGEQGPLTPLVLAALLTAIVAHDVITTRKIERATLLGAVFAVSLNVGGRLVAATGAGQALVRWLQ